MDKSKANSRYKSIGEVAKILSLVNERNGSLSTHTIRFWEKQFKQIKPKTFIGNRRYYDENSIKILKKIKYLLKDKGMTLNGVKKVLNSKDSDIDESYNDIIRQKDFIKSKIKKIKKIVTLIKNNG
tara:strand:- start:336 stop:713 length:378 start_codon:yes stop_codon:yes gene_type:complete